MTPASYPRQQRGAALIVALVVLVIVTLLGISSMTTTQIESRGAATVAADNKLRQATDSLAYRLMSTPPSGVNPIHLLTNEVLNYDATDADWEKVDKARTDGRNWPLPDDCGSARWRVRKLHPDSGAPGNTEGYAYYEIEVECYLRENAVLDTGLLASADVGPLSRVVSGMRIINPSTD